MTFAGRFAKVIGLPGDTRFSVSPIYMYQYNVVKYYNVWFHG